MSESNLIVDERLLDGQYLTFSLAGQEYGLEIRYVTQITQMQPITKMPKTKAHIKGVMNLRGVIVPVIDLRAKLSLPEAEYDSRTCIIVVCVNGKTAGLIVDWVDFVCTFNPEDIDLPMFINNDASVTGIGKRNDKLYVLLNGLTLVEYAEDVVILEKITA